MRVCSLSATTEIVTLSEFLIAKPTPAALETSYATPMKEDEWIEVRRRGRERQYSTSSSTDVEVVVEERKGNRSRQASLSISKPVVANNQPGEEALEELDFQFDEELDRPLPVGKQNTFTEWSDSEEEECDEVGDDFINKVLEFN